MGSGSPDDPCPVAGEWPKLQPTGEIGFAQSCLTDPGTVTKAPKRRKLFTQKSKGSLVLTVMGSVATVSGEFCCGARRLPRRGRAGHLSGGVSK